MATKTVFAEKSILDQKVDTPTPAVFHGSVDKYTDLRRELDSREAELQPLRDNVEYLETELREFADQLVEASRPVTLYGEHHLADFAAKGKRVVDVDKDLLKSILDMDLLWELAQFTVTDLKRYLSGDQLEKVLRYEHVTKRKLKVSDLPE